jgi:hypothetical protein
MRPDYFLDPAYIAGLKKIGRIQVSVDTLVSPTPAFIYALGIASDGGGEADAIVYDGHLATGDFYIHLDTLDEFMHWISFTQPMYFRQGIYVDIGTNVAQVVIQYLPIKE